MAIKRYFAKKDNTITNAFEENLTTRGTASNMGAADILEVFSIYAQASSASAEASRVLIKFDCTASTNSILSDRQAGTIPASGNVSFYLRMFNAPHGQTLPKSYTMDVSAISGSWNEGTGLDMETYKDKGSSSWVNATSTSTAATATVTVLNEGFIENDDVVILDATNGSRVILALNDSDTPTAEAVTAVSTAGSTSADDAVLFARHNGASTTAQATLIATAINHHSLFTATSEGAVVTITQVTAGAGGNTTVTCVDGGGAGPWFSNTNFTGGRGTWATEGGDYFTDVSSSFTASFDIGTEDIELDITTLVEQWCSSSTNSKTATDMGSKPDEGVLIKISNTYESASRSYYTKKFFARGTEFHFKQPHIEARWNSSVEDDRGNFYYSSSLATAEENLNSIYLYNYFRGRLRNIPGVGTGNIGVSIYSSSAGSPAGAGIKLVADGTHVRSANRYVATGSYVSTGIYSASFAMTAASNALSTVHDVWFKLSDSVTSASTGTQYVTGTISPQRVSNATVAPTNDYVVSITNMRNFYRSDETARFRIYTRQKDWSPTIYSKAVSTAQVQVIESGSYEIVRVIDDLKVVPYGTGSTKHTVLSYDASGSYFDLDMSMLEEGYMYGIKLAFYNEDIGAWAEQPETFKFKVDSRQS